MTPTSPRGSEPEIPDADKQYICNVCGESAVGDCEYVDHTDDCTMHSYRTRRFVAVDALLTDEAVERGARAIAPHLWREPLDDQWPTAGARERVLSNSRKVLEAVLGVGHE